MKNTCDIPEQRLDLYTKQLRLEILNCARPGNQEEDSLRRRVTQLTGELYDAKRSLADLSHLKKVLECRIETRACDVAQYQERVEHLHRDKL